LGGVQWPGLDSLSTNFNQEALDNDCEDKDNDEHFVVEEALEDVQLIITDLSCINQVEDLKEYKHLEDNSVMEHLVCSLEKWVL